MEKEQQLKKLNKLVENDSKEKIIGYVFEYFTIYELECLIEFIEKGKNVKYYKLKICPPIVGSDITVLLKADNEKEADQMALEKTMEHYESYGITPEKEEEESGTELEYDYTLKEISEKEYKEYFKEGYDEIN